MVTKKEGLRLSFGNASEAMATRGWFVGHFLGDDKGLCHTNDLEIKWGQHKKGEGKDELGVNDMATSVTILVSGVFETEFPEDNITHVLERPGDYQIYGPGVPHRWRVLKECVVITIRWPSIPGDQRFIG